MNLPQHLFDIQNVSYAFISLILFSVLMGSFLVYCLRTKNTHKSYKEQIALLEARSLRAQMNPHFIFNVLNGLQSILILKSEQEVNRYMGHLSNLLRMTLDLSKKEAINLGEEIGYLKSYIELQRIRHGRFIAMKNLGTAHGLFKPTSTLHPHCLPWIKILINTIRPKM